MFTKVTISCELSFWYLFLSQMPTTVLIQMAQNTTKVMLVLVEPPVILEMVTDVINSKKKKKERQKIHCATLLSFFISVACFSNSHDYLAERLLIVAELSSKTLLMRLYFFIWFRNMQKCFDANKQVKRFQERNVRCSQLFA